MEDTPNAAVDRADVEEQSNVDGLDAPNAATWLVCYSTRMTRTTTPQRLAAGHDCYYDYYYYYRFAGVVASSHLAATICSRGYFPGFLHQSSKGLVDLSEYHSVGGIERDYADESVGGSRLDHGWRHDLDCRYRYGHAETSP